MASEVYDDRAVLIRCHVIEHTVDAVIGPNFASVGVESRVLRAAAASSRREFHNSISWPIALATSLTCVSHSLHNVN